MVCTELTPLHTPTRTGAEFKNSNRWRDQHVWIQMGTDGQQRQLQDSRTLLRVWCETTHHVCNTTDRTRVQHTVQRHTNNVTQQRFLLQLGREIWTLLPSHEAGQHPRQHEVRHQHDRNNRISSNYTSDHHTNRNQEWRLSETETTHGHSTHKDFWSEHTGQHVKHSSYQIADVQYQQTDLRTTEEPLSTDKMATTKTLKTNTKTSTSHNRKESCKDQHGLEKHGSEWRKEPFSQATDRHNHQQNHHNHSRYQKQRRHQHRQHNNRWQDTPIRGQLKTHHTSISKHLHQQLRFHIPKMFNQHQIIKRVHIQPRMDLYIPQQTDDGPDITRLTQQRRTLIRPIDGTRGHAVEVDWTTKRQATFGKEWTGSTNFENFHSSRTGS